MTTDTPKPSYAELDHMVNILQHLHTNIFYTQQEVNKLIDAFKKEYNIPDCDELPYYPKATRIVLNGTEIKDL